MLKQHVGQRTDPESVHPVLSLGESRGAAESMGAGDAFAKEEEKPPLLPTHAHCNLSLCHLCGGRCGKSQGQTAHREATRAS